MTGIAEIRRGIEENHWRCIEPFIGGRGGFGETFCGHIHELNMTFTEQAEHYHITLDELALVTADHIRNLMPNTFYHKIHGGNTCPDPDEVELVYLDIVKEGLLPMPAVEWANLVPEAIRNLPIVWFAEKINSPKGLWLSIDAWGLEAERLHKLDIKDDRCGNWGVSWWVYQGSVPPRLLSRVSPKETPEQT